ncbi:MAG TPA: hypothetical protein PKE27_10295 [Povalibacter sp.]|uniref:hypothetical protein n=1 Tax=Povalibacter sp. TaxID=1962978 RepID=UPI002CFD5A22|nr:hypothetical protein [Povalibacter sp.]HMN44955.1 hypothetical protein [Povalibacter sp.]
MSSEKSGCTGVGVSMLSGVVFSPMPRATLAACAALALSGCMTAKIEEVRDAPTRISSNEAVVLLAKPHLEGTGTESKFLDCLERELVGEAFSSEHAAARKKGKDMSPRSNVANKPFQVFADDHFVDAFYPWLEPSTAPVNPQAFSTFLSRPGVAERVSSLGVRFIVWVDGVTQKTDGGGSIACAVGPGGAGCLGLGWWEKQSDYEATVWDLRDGVSAGTVTTDVKGTSVMIGAVAPIPIISPVQSTACDRLAGQLRSFLVGADDDPDVAPKQTKAAQ